MKNFKKLLVTLLALVLLVGGATVIALAADTPEQIMADARDLLDQAANDDEFIAVRSQKMRELDKLIDSNLATIKGTQAWRDFQIEYLAAQKQLKEDCITQANATLDLLLDRDTTASEAAAYYAGLSSLVAMSGDSRGYFDVASAEYEMLNVRMKVAFVIERLQSAEDPAPARNKAQTLLAIDNYKTGTLDLDEAAVASEDYQLIAPWFKAIYESISEALYEEVYALVDEACLPETSLEVALGLVADIDAYFEGCYFDKTANSFGSLRSYSYFAKAYAYLNEIERTVGVVAKGMKLQDLVNVVGATPFDTTSPMYTAFNEAYQALINPDDASSVVAQLYAMAEDYKAQIAEVFEEGYAGAITTKKQLSDLADELDGLIIGCYFPKTTYKNDVAVAMAYAGIYEFYVEFSKDANTAEEIIARNKYYKEAVSVYDKYSATLMGGDDAFKQPFLDLYTSLISEASIEINSLLKEWTDVANQCQSELNGEFVLSYEQVMNAYLNLEKYYINKDTALFFRKEEDKALTASIKTSLQRSEDRFIKDYKKRFEAAEAILILPEDHLTVDTALLAEKKAALDNLYEISKGVNFVYVNLDNVVEFRHKLSVSMLMVRICAIEIEYNIDPESQLAADLYIELKNFSVEVGSNIDVEAADYLLYLSYLNAIEVAMSAAYIPNAIPLLEAVEAIVDDDNFDKVYKLMHLNEYIRKNSIARPDASDTTSQSALFYARYDAVVNKINEYRQAKVAEREINVTISEYNSTGTVKNYDIDKTQLGCQKGDHTFYSKDDREHGSQGSMYYATFEYTKGSGSDGFISVPLASPTQNMIIEMDITTFTTWPSTGVSFNSGTNGLTTGKRIYPWIGAITGSGQIQVPNGSARPTVTNREGGYIIPGQWTHIIIVYNAVEKMVSYYVNDEKIVDSSGNDSWSCALSDSYNFNEALRLGHANSGGGSFSVDNVLVYIGDTPRDVNKFSSMSNQQLFAFYADYAYNYLNNGVGNITDAKLSIETLTAQLSRYWGIKNEGDESKTYIFDETTYWDPAAPGYVDPKISYADFKAAVDKAVFAVEESGDVIENAMQIAALDRVKSDIAKIEALTGIESLNARKNLLIELNAFIEENFLYLGGLTGTMLAEYNQQLAKKEAIVAEIEAYDRANEYIEMVNKFAAAKDLYSRTVYRSQAEGLMNMMEVDAAAGAFDLDAVKAAIPEFVEAIAIYEAASDALDQLLVQDNDKIIIDCMSRFPAIPEDAIKEYDRLNKYIVMVRRILNEGNYTATNLLVQEALVVYEQMNPLFYDALQNEHKLFLQDLIDKFNAEKSYVTRLGIYKAIVAYFEDNKDSIDLDHEAVLTITVQFEAIEERFGTEEGREAEWELYGEQLKSNSVKFSSMVTQMRFADSYAELGELREQAAALFYYMDTTTADAKLAIEYYLACETILTQKALDGDLFIEAAYALSKANTMKDVYKAILVAKAAYAKADTTYSGALVFTETVNEVEYTYTFTMEDAVNAYEIALSQYNSFVTVINNEVNTVLDIVCAARADFSVHQPVVALFKKIYD